MRKNTLTLAVLGAIAIGAQNGLVYADDAPASQKLETVTVTGSNIRRTDSETPSPVQVITAEDLKRTGQTSISEVLRNITANNQGTLSQAFSGAFAAGASGVALRGLTVGATLVLIDGHRTAPYALSDDGQRSFVDISAIPFDAVERIEVLKDGASAVYGSDAIAGVVNVILKKSFTGTRINVEGGTTMYGDGGTQHLSIIHGVGDSGYFSAEYRHQAPILLVNRSGNLTKRDYTDLGGVNATPGVPNVNNAGYPTTLGGYTVDGNGNIAGFPGGCVPNGNNCAWFNRSLQLQPDTHNINLIGKFTQALSGDWTATGTASMFSSSAEQVGGYSSTGFLNGGVYGITAGPGVAPALYPSTGLYSTVVPAGDLAGNFLQTPFTGIGVGHTAVDSQTWRAIAEASGPAFGWDTSVSAGFTKSIVHERLTGQLSISGLQSLVAANPNANAQQLNTILQNPANTPILGPLASSTSTAELDFITLSAGREVAQLPGGPLSVAVGVDYTHHALSTLAPPSIAQGLQAGNDSFAVGEQDDASAYAEFEAHVLKELEVDGAVRVDSVNTYGTSTTPKFGIKYSPLSSLTLRGTYSEGFRAPNPAENGQAGQAFLYNQISDPTLCANGGKGATTDYVATCNIIPTYFQQSNPNLKPERSTSYTFGLIFEPITGYSATVDYYDIKIKDQIASAINIYGPSSLLGSVVRSPVTSQLYAQTNGNLAPLPAGTGLIAYIPTAYVNANSLRTNGVDLDFLAHFTLPDSSKLTTDLSVSHVFHYTVSQTGTDYELAGTHGPSGIGGDTGTPQTRASLTVTWDQGPLELAATANYISHFSVTDPISGVPDCVSAIDFNFNGSFSSTSTPNASLCQVASFTTIDLFGRYNLTKSLTLHGSITNALNRQPPIDLETYGGSNYNPSMHQAGAVGRFFNVGATYDF